MVNPFAASLLKYTSLKLLLDKIGAFKIQIDKAVRKSTKQTDWLVAEKIQTVE